MADLPVLVRRSMQARGVSLRGLARAAHYDPSYLSKVLSGRKPVTSHLAARLDDALDADGQIRDAAHEQASGRPVKAMRSSPRRPLSRVAEALQATAAAGTAGLEVAADGLAELIPHYSHLVSTTTSVAVYDELLSVRSFANSLLGDTVRGLRSDLVATAGWLSALLAMSATDMGDHAAALVWCSDTERQGRDAGHPELAGWAAVGKWYHRRAIHALRTLLPEAECCYAISWEPVYDNALVTRDNWPKSPDGRRRVIRERQEVSRRVADGDFRAAVKARGAWR